MPIREVISRRNAQHASAVKTEQFGDFEKSMRVSDGIRRDSSVSKANKLTADSNRPWSFEKCPTNFKFVAETP